MEAYVPENFEGEAGNPIISDDIVQNQLKSVSHDIASILNGMSDDVSTRYLMEIMSTVKTQLQVSMNEDEAKAVDIRINNMMAASQAAKIISKQNASLELATASADNKGMFQELSPEQRIAYLLKARELLEVEFTKRPRDMDFDEIRMRIGLSRLLNEQIYSIFTDIASKTRLVFTEHMYPLLVCAAVLLGGDGSARYGIIATLLFGILATESAKLGENFNDPVRPLILRIKDQLLTCGERGIDLAADTTAVILQLLAKFETIRRTAEETRNIIVTKSFTAIVDVGSTIKATLNGFIDCWQIANEFNPSQSSQSSQESIASNASTASIASNASTMALLVGKRKSLGTQLTQDNLAQEVMPVVDVLLEVLASGDSGIKRSGEEGEEEEGSKRNRVSGGRRSRRHKKRRSTLKRRRIKRRRTRKGKKRRHTKRR